MYPELRSWFATKDENKHLHNSYVFLAKQIMVVGKTLMKAVMYY